MMSLSPDQMEWAMWEKVHPHFICSTYEYILIFLSHCKIFRIILSYILHLDLSYILHLVFAFNSHSRKCILTIVAAPMIVSSYLLTGGSYWPKTNASELHFARSFQGHPTWPYLARPNMHPNMHIWHIWPYLAYLGAYLGARNMVKWGVPEKILQNAVQTHWS